MASEFRILLRNLKLLICNERLRNGEALFEERQSIVAFGWGSTEISVVASQALDASLVNLQVCKAHTRCKPSDCNW